MALLNFQNKKLFQLDYTVRRKETLSKLIKGKEDNVNIAVKEPISMMVKSSEKDLYKPKLVLE